MTVISTGFFQGYRNPRFCVDHLLRDEGISALSGWTSEAGFPLDRILDNQIGDVARLSSIAAVTLELGRAIHPTVTHRVPINRIVAFGLNAHANLTRVHVETSPDDAVYTALLQNDPDLVATEIGPMVYHCAPPDGVIDWHVDPSRFGVGVPVGSSPTADGVFDRYWHFIIEAGKAGYTAPEIAELWLTRTLTTGEGVAHKWDNGVLPNASNSRTSAGLVTAMDKNPSGARDPARYAITYNALAPGVDLTTLRYVAFKAGIRKNVLLYEHADHGNTHAVVDNLETHTTTFPGGNTTLSTSSGTGPSSQDVVRMTSNASGDYSYVLLWASHTSTGGPLSTTIDLRDKVVEFWLNGNVAANIAQIISGGIWLDIFSGVTADKTAGATAYKLSSVFDVEDLASTWYRIALDPTTWTDTELYPIAGVYDTNPVDLGQVGLIGFRANADQAGRIVDASRLVIRPKSLSPVPCLLTAYDERQIGKQPSGAAGARYDVSMAFEEVTT